MREPCTREQARRLIRNLLVLRLGPGARIVEHPASPDTIRVYVARCAAMALRVDLRTIEVHVQYAHEGDTVHAYLAYDRAEIVGRLAPVLTHVLSRPDDDY